MLHSATNRQKNDAVTRKVFRASVNVAESQDQNPRLHATLSSVSTSDQSVV